MGLSLPLWSNPLLLSPSHPPSLDSSFADFLDAGVHCLRRLLEVERAALAVPTQAAYTTDVRGHLLRSSCAFVQHVALERVAQPLAALPQRWVARAATSAAIGGCCGCGGCCVPVLFLPHPLAASLMAALPLWRLFTVRTSWPPPALLPPPPAVPAGVRWENVCPPPAVCLSPLQPPPPLSPPPLLQSLPSLYKIPI